MKIAVTGGTGFIGSYIVRQLLEDGHQLQCWFRDEMKIDTSHSSDSNCQWIEGELGDHASTNKLIENCDAVVHAALWKPGSSFRGGEGNIVEFCQRNFMGTLQLMEAARVAGVQRFVFVSTCAVYEEILTDRLLDEAHPLWPHSHYGAHKAALEKFVHSYGLGTEFPICALRPTGVYGIDRPICESKWFDLVKSIVNGESVAVKGGGKEVHVSDVARTVVILLNADADVSGQAFNCYDKYISRFDVAQIAKRLAGSSSKVVGEQQRPKHQIDTAKIRGLGMTFGGDSILESTIANMVEFVRKSS